MIFHLAGHRHLVEIRFISPSGTPGARPTPPSPWALAAPAPPPPTSVVGPMCCDVTELVQPWNSRQIETMREMPAR